MYRLVIPGLRQDLHDVDLVVGEFWPTVRQHLAPYATDDALGTCKVQPAEGGSPPFAVYCTPEQQALWDALHGAFDRGERFRAVGG